MLVIQQLAIKMKMEKNMTAHGMATGGCDHLLVCDVADECV